MVGSSASTSVINEAAWMHHGSSSPACKSGIAETVNTSDLIGSLENMRKENEDLRATLDTYKKILNDSGRKGIANFSDCPSNLYEQLRDRVESVSFLQKLEEIKSTEDAVTSIDLPLAEDDLVTAGIDDPRWWVWVSTDLFGAANEDAVEEEYTLVNENDIIEGIAAFLARYITSIPKSKTMTPNQLQDAIALTFKHMENKGQLWRLWQMGMFLYSTISWGTTAFRFTTHPMILRAFLITVSTSMKFFLKIVS